MIILGVDPGSRITGFGLIDSRADRLVYLHSGSIRAGDGSMPERLGCIFDRLGEVIRDYRPAQFGIESVFMAKNADSALKLGQARGAAIGAARQAGLEVAEYAAREVKQAVVGTGAADKTQVAHMVRRLLGLRRELLPDEADGLAIAICHAQIYATRQKTGIATHLLKRRRSRHR